MLAPNLLILDQAPIIPNDDPTNIGNKIFERGKSIYKDVRNQHGRPGEMNILHCYARDTA